MVCEGDYAGHLQGVCTDEASTVYWSFTTTLVKTDHQGKIQKKIEVPDHHGDLCFYNDRLYVAVNLGKFNDPKGNADSWVYVYDSQTLALLSKHPTPEVFHGAGGIGVRDGQFYIVGGLPAGVEENYVYEYNSDFVFTKKHIIKSGWTQVGIQTATFHDGAWWFGCYGNPQILLKTDAAFNMLGRYEFDCSLGIIGTGKDQFLIAKGSRNAKKEYSGSLFSARPDEVNGLRILPKP
ncbi:MAG: hypothetical protein COA73_11735 [Candidatus Hydrogenedentota bacterium]|nr:MAG: hypothetical protein COA73_11735 [Candidatus Hydrogenedentota bacterium]